MQSSLEPHTVAFDIWHLRKGRAAGTAFNRSKRHWKAECAKEVDDFLSKAQINCSLNVHEFYRRWSPRTAPFRIIQPICSEFSQACWELTSRKITGLSLLSFSSPDLSRAFPPSPSSSHL
jgi:hypothetical protein